MTAKKNQMTLQDFFQTVYVPFRLTDASPSTIEQCMVAIRRLSCFLGRDATIDDFREMTLAGWMAHERGRGCSPVTCNGRRRILLTLWRFAKRKRHPIPKGQDLESVDKLREPKRVPQAWAAHEMEAIIESARLARGRFLGVPADKWWVALILTLYDTGLRRNAAFGIQFSEIDFKSKMLLVPPDRMKNAVEQYFRLSDQTIAAILETLPPRRSKVFPLPFADAKPLNARLRMILYRAQLPITARDLFHKFRRTCASHIAQRAGKHAAVMQLGHQNEGTVSRYIDPRFTANHDGARFLPRPSWLDPTPIEVEALPAESAPQPTKVVQVPEDDLTGKAEDVLAALLPRIEEDLTVDDIRTAIEAIGMSQREFAEHLDISPGWLSTVLNENLPIKASFQRRIKIGLGFKTPGRPGRPPRSAKGTLLKQPQRESYRERKKP